ncbi:MAG: hypothetical protein ACE5DI_03830 [Candidatus Micrarchaeia archaeon]
MKADMSMWILTKFAMIFFIFALAAIIIFFGKIQNEDVCSKQARLATLTISSRISQVVFSPVEDERRVYSFPRVIPIGEGNARYRMTIYPLGNSKTQTLSMNLSTIGTPFACGGGSAVSVDDFTAVYVKGDLPSKADFSPNPQAWLFTPSVQVKDSESFEDSEISKYLVIIKCSSKTLFGSSPRKYLFLQNCYKEYAEECWTLEKDVITNCCGWSSGNCPY